MSSNNTVQIQKSGVTQVIRSGISRTPLTKLYERVKAIADGARGGMNQGIYIVRKISTGKLYVEKRFKPHPNDQFTIRLAMLEIYLLKRLVHNSIVFYQDAYVRENPFDAAVYMEYCDRGSLSNLIQVYQQSKTTHQQHFIPESFIWHAFVGLADALYFLKTGESYISTPIHSNQGKKWTPIIHRDIKPDNIFLRSHDTPGSKKPLYVLLSDFGLASPDDKDPSVARKPSGVRGTPEFHAPELCFQPFPATHQMDYQAQPHTAKSDVWALACMMFAMCERDEFAHLNRYCFPMRSQKCRGRDAILSMLDITQKQEYSEYLERCIKWAGNKDPRDRPDPRVLIREVKGELDKWVKDPNWTAQVAVAGELPDWATKKSDVS
ncbi:kinase-like domain-containing protein [Pseudomassariella vexata]|uniref:non-specific serine/threonine protein kinase n=1 Tax=Pseudomassariella vexata TaxID=1141098 RepID=A0A1Y2DK84_9PEZI|nr:kinase-like domain-containing protein [Pseudomassariella vexata]ORY59589.1 kinase-like domain-containing protein [Pseudomassariella vexata]